MTDTSARRRRRLHVLALVTALAAGGIVWWLSSGDDGSADGDRAELEAVAGVSAVRTDPDDADVPADGYLVEFDASIGTDDLGAALDRIRSIVDTNLVGAVGKVRFALDLTGSPHRTAAIVTSITAIDPADLDTLPLSGEVDIWLGEQADLLESTHRLLDGLADAGVDDFEDFAGQRLEVRPSTGAEHATDEHDRELSVQDLGVTEARDRLATLIRATEQSGSTLFKAFLDGDSTEVTISIERAADAAPARNALLAAFRGRQLDITLQLPDLEIRGNEDPARALRFAAAVRGAGGRIEWIHADGSNVEMSADSLEGLTNVVNLTRDPKRWLVSRNARVAIKPPFLGFDYWMESNDAGQLRNNLPLITALWRAGYATSYHYRADLAGDRRHALGVAPRLSEDGRSIPGNLVDDVDGRIGDKLAQVLRTGSWPGTIRLEIHGSDRPGSPVAFSTTVTGPAQEVAEKPLSKGEQAFLDSWNATA